MNTNMIFRLSVVLGVLVLVTGTSSRAFPAPVVTAKVVAVSGESWVTSPEGQRRPLKLGEVLPPEHTLETESEAKVVLELSDRSRVEVSGGAKLEINELLDKRESKFSLSLFCGRLALNLYKLVGRGVVVCPILVVGVRGSLFTVGVADDGLTVVSVDKGQVEVSTDLPDRAPVQTELGPGQEIQLDQAGDPLRPRKATVRSMGDWFAFRQQRLKKMSSQMVSITEQMNQAIDVRLRKLERTRDAIVQKADEMRAIVKKIRVFTQGGARTRLTKKQRQELVVELRTKAAELSKLFRGFRAQRMRMRHVFIKAESMKQLIQSGRIRLKPDQQTAEDRLSEILARKDEVRARVMEISREVRTAVRPLGPVFNKIKEFRNKSSD